MTDPNEAAQVRQIWSELGLPGLIDVHTHFMPKSVMDKVWRYFDSAGPLVGRLPIGQPNPGGYRCCGSSAYVVSRRWSTRTNRRWQRG
jgi:uncharacterized protein